MSNDTSPPSAGSADGGLVAVLERSRSLGHLGAGAVRPHIDHAEAMAALIERLQSTPRCAVDLGTGGGVPGLVLARRFSDAVWFFVEGSVSRAEFLRSAVDELALDNVTVLGERAELAARRVELRGRVDLVTARAFGAPAVVAECAAPLLRMGGVVVVSEPPHDSAERWPDAGLAALGLVAEAAPGVPRFQALRRVGECSDRFPRRVGVPGKRPLF